MKSVEARVHGLVFDQKQQQHVVVLREAEGERVLPIWIGPAEALAIQRLLSGQAFPRPLTHDLFALVLEGLHARVTRVTIAEMREGTFFATLVIERENSVLSVDARPSDSIAHRAAHAGAAVRERGVAAGAARAGQRARAAARRAADAAADRGRTRPSSCAASSRS